MRNKLFTHTVLTTLIGLLTVSTLAQNSNFPIPRLSPKPSDVFGVEKEMIDLDGQWKFNPHVIQGFEKELDSPGWSDIQVPGEWSMQGFNVDSAVTAGYFRTFIVPRDWKQKRIKLRFNAVYSEAIVFINGQKAGSHNGGFTAFELDITDLVNVGKTNTLALAVKNESLENSLSSGSRYACHPLGGISRSVYLMALPQVNMSSLAIQTVFDSEYQDATLTALIEISNESHKDVSELKMSFILSPWKSDKKILLENNEIGSGMVKAGGTAKIVFNVPVAKPNKWDCENPNLYVLTTKLIRDDKVIEIQKQRFGFRQSEVIGNQIFVNGNPVMLRGVNRHEVYPLTGRSIPKEMYRKDVELFREGNVNHIRTCHYQPDEALMEVADELGMFIECEGPYCWSHETKGDPEATKEAITRQNLEMIVLNRNHPSIIFWSLANESIWTSDYEFAGQQMAALDPTRPRTFNYFPWDWVKNELKDEAVCEIGSDHYPSPTGPEKYANYHRPINFGEFVHLNAYNRNELATDVALRDKWGIYLHKMWEAMYKAKGVAGGSIWAGIDDTFYWDYVKEDGSIEERTVGYGTWGPIDGWRRKKPEWWGMKKTYSPVRVSEPEWVGGKIDGVRGGNSKNMANKIVFIVENRQDFSNLNRLEIQWKLGKESGTLDVNIAPREEGRIEIGPLPQQDLEANLELVFMDPRGFMVDSFFLPVKPHITSYEVPEIGTTTRFKLTEKKDHILVTVNENEFRIDSKTGLLTGKDFSGPHLMILPLNNGGDTQMHGPTKYYEPYTHTCTEWKLDSIKSVFEPGITQVIVHGSYKEAEGVFTYNFTASGNLEINWDFESLEDVSPRQMGIVFDFQSSYENLTWKRKGYWSTYPEWHIARLEGTANASEGFEATPVGPRTKPDHEWRLDRTKIGSNDFASTKHNIYHTSLTNDQGKGVKVIGSGKLHTRTWIEGESIRMLIANYSNGGAERFLRPHAKVDDKPLKIGDQISGSVNLKITE